MGTVVRISEALSLAFHGLGLLVVRGGRMNARELAQSVGASEAHLAKVFSRLGKHGIVAATRGPGGGFVLAKKPSDVRLIDVYEAIEGTPEEGNCLLNCEVCPFGRCLFGGLLGKLSAEFLAYLRSVTLADLAKGERHERTHSTEDHPDR